ncbi:unnamed protein product [Caenorhabditis brenneri]
MDTSVDLNENIVGTTVHHKKKVRKRHFNYEQSFSQTGPYTMDDWKAGNQAGDWAQGEERDVTTVGGPIAGVSQRRLKRHDTAFSLFSKERELMLTDVQKRKMAGGINGSLLAEWKTMTPKEKAPYEEKEAMLKAINEAVSIPVQKPAMRIVQAFPSQKTSCKTTLAEPNLPPDLAAITPTMLLPDDFPWKDVFESLNITPFDF